MKKKKIFKSAFQEKKDKRDELIMKMYSKMTGQQTVICEEIASKIPNRHGRMGIAASTVYRTIKKYEKQNP